MDKIIEYYDVTVYKKHFLIACSLQSLSDSNSQLVSNQGNIECI